MEAGKKVAVVILNWNGRQLLEQFLPALIKNTPSWVDLIVGDNASTDDSIQFMQDKFPQVLVLSNPVNHGYAGGYNMILERVEADYFALLNSDLEVTPGWIEPLLEYMVSNPFTAVCQPKVRSFVKKTHFEYAGAAGGYMDRFGYFFCRGRIFDHLEEDRGQYDDAREVFWASGAAFFVDVPTFRKAGGFDALLFAHMEEIDLCWRFKRMGKKIAYVPTSLVYHIGGGTLHKLSPQKTFLNFRNNLVLLYKNLPRRITVMLIPFRFFLDLLAWVRFLLLGEIGHAFAINRAHIDFLRNLKSWKRNRIRQVVLFDPEKNSRLKGLYLNSIVLDFFVLKTTSFSSLNPKRIT